MFLITLYTFDKKPENSIAKQYLGTVHMQITAMEAKP